MQHSPGWPSERQNYSVHAPFRSARVCLHWAELTSMTAGEGRQKLVAVSVAGQTTTTTPRFFDYLPPTITSINPLNGPTQGGIQLTLGGSRFATTLDAFQASAYPLLPAVSARLASSVWATSHVPWSLDRTRTAKSAVCCRQDREQARTSPSPWQIRWGFVFSHLRRCFLTIDRCPT